MFKRAVAAVIWVVFTVQTVACSSTRRVETAVADVPDPGIERIVGVTTLEGEVVNFDRTRPAVVRNDSVVAVRADGLAYAAAMADVERLWVERRHFDAVKTVALTVGVVVGTALLAVAIVAATKESCPFVYSWDGSQYVFDAEPYGGAITRGMERDDYAELENLRPDAGEYRLRLTNEVNETQYTNLTELWVVDHPVGTRVAVDEHGGIHTVHGQVAPHAAVNGAGQDLLPWLAETDLRVWEPRPVADAQGSLREDIVLTFPKPAGATSVKLVANVATGLWGSHMIREMLALRGDEVHAFYARVDAEPAEYDSLLAWSLRDDLYLMNVFVEEPTGWEWRGVLPGGGPFIAEHRVVPLDVSRVEGTELRVRIRPTRGFWALNSFAVDYASNVPVRVDTVAPVRARDSYGRDVLADLRTADSAYYDMPQTGDWAEVAFPAPPQADGVTRTVLLHSRGYYRLHLAEGGTPNMALVNEILQVPGTAARFAADRYREHRATRAGIGF
jgi:hypothetical protein